MFPRYNMYNSSKNGIHRMTPNWTWTLSSQKYSIYIKYLPVRPKFQSISLYDYLFPKYNMYKVSENWKCIKWPQMELKHLTAKVLYIHYILTPKAHILVHFALPLAISEIHVHGRRKSEMHWTTPNWTWTLNSQKHSTYTKHLPLRPKFWSISLYD